MRPRDCPKYVIILKKGNQKRYRYVYNDNALADEIENGILGGCKVFKVFKADYEELKGCRGL